MKEGEFRVSKATLYNTLELLLDCNLVRKHQFDNKNAQYEKSFRVAQHDHVIIADTGEVLEFCDRSLTIPLYPPRASTSLTI